MTDSDKSKEVRRIETETASASSDADDPFFSVMNQHRLRRSIDQLESTGGTIHDVILDDALQNGPMFKD